MTEPAVEPILAELQAPGAHPVALLQAYRAEAHGPLWQQDARLYRAFGRALVSAGQATAAFELVREGVLQFPEDHELLYLRALALARGGNLLKAEEYAHELLESPDLDPAMRVEALGLAGRLLKDRYQAHGREAPARLAQESANLYDGAYHLTGKSYPAINAAAMSLLAGQPAEKVRRKAQAALEQATREQREPGRDRDYWLAATLGEAHLLLGNLPEAKHWYGEAIALADGRLGDRASMRRDVWLLRQHVGGAAEVLALFDRGTVVAFVGHRFDPPGPLPPGAGPRFPPDPRLEARVREAIREELDRLKPEVGYCCGACGADLLFAELMLERNKELHLVLPYARADFYTTSVDFGRPQGQDWRRRFDAVAARAQFHYGTEEPYLGEGGLLEFVSAFGQGLAVARAAELGVEAWALGVVDLGSPVRQGGTRYFLNSWADQGRQARLIDLARLRDEVGARAPDWEAAAPPQQPAPGPLTREPKVMLFADVKNYSRLSDEKAPAFFMEFLGEVGQVIQSMRRYPALCNTWGDGLFVVFNHVVDGADFALRLVERIEGMDFARLGLPEDTTVRVGLHAGPVYPHWDRLIGRLNFFGTHVNRAARIEPKTPPGCVYASEQFAALLAIEPGHEFACEYVGVYQLGKEHDQFRCPLYRLRRKSG